MELLEDFWKVSLKEIPFFDRNSKQTFSITSNQDGIYRKEFIKSRKTFLDSSLDFRQIQLNLYLQTSVIW